MTGEVDEDYVPPKRASARAPKKYLDAKRTQVTEEWKAWDAQVNSDEVILDHLVANGFDPDRYFPTAEKAIPAEGAWILVIEVPHTELADRFDVPLLSMWRARPHTLNTRGPKVPGGRVLLPQQAVIATPGGDLHLWPNEYIVAKNPMGLASDPDAELHPLGGSPVIDEDQLFYLQSRGISHSDAVLMLFDRIESFDFVYVTFPEEITAMLEGVGRPLHRHIALNPQERQDTA